MTRVLVVGNSVAIYVRPAGGRPYGRVLEAALTAGGGEARVEVWAENSITAADVARSLEDRLVAFSPDVLVLNLGIVDCTPRILPQWLRRRFVRGRTRLQRLMMGAEGLLRRPLVSLLGGAPAIPESVFEASLIRIVEIAAGECAASSICLGLPPTSPRVVREAPGIGSHIERFDGAIRRVCARAGATYVDVGGLSRECGPETFLPDGIHFSAAGHARIAEELARLIRGRLGSPERERPRPVPEAAPRSFGWASRVTAVPLAFAAALWILATRLSRLLRRAR